ncbi:hypothetical protein HPB49_012290 [Dermacentor silvarum]|uniref:Uncharacterized protein n=1 Tax=Dermacentor silvarum TaxID=543639 RepID=A0ACB8D5D5_DERSI|nr:hypothetical protein HPB49_012290 [Dermacentor silvarum]
MPESQCRAAHWLSRHSLNFANGCAFHPALERDWSAGSAKWDAWLSAATDAWPLRPYRVTSGGRHWRREKRAARPEMGAPCFPIMGCKSTQIAWTSRVRTLSRQLGFLAQPLQASGAQKLSHVTRQRVREVETEELRSAMLGKSTLQLYRSHKSTPATENIYDNDTASALLFEARAKALGS